MAHSLENPVTVAFPLRGEGWMAVTTPATRVPSHGTDMLGQRYAFDLVRVDRRRGVHVSPGGTVRALVLGTRTRDCYAWGASVHAPFDGEVVRAVDGFPERRWIHPVAEVFRMVRNAVTFTPERLPSILGNHVILRSGDLFAGVAHLAPGTVAVTPGQRVARGGLLGRVGHTGNSTSPHLHVQLMDSPDLMTANGIACAFTGYEVDRDGRWEAVTGGIPNRRERVRSTGPD